MIENIFVSLLGISVTTSIVILLLKLLSSLINKSYAAKWKYWIWLVLALRLIIPFNISSPITPVNVSIPNKPLSEFVNPDPAQPAAGTMPIQIENGGIKPDTNVPDSIILPEKNSVTGINIAALIWLVGIGFFLVYQVMGYFIFKKKALRWSKPPINAGITARLHAVALDMRVTKKIEILISKNVSSPLIVGYKKSILFLPNENYSETDLDFIFRHELTHFKRHDLWYKLFLVIVNAVHWFNPFVYLLFREASSDLELSCDDEVTKGMPYSDRKVYSEAILASITGQKGYRTTLSTYFHGGKKTMKSRFVNILNTRRKRNGAIILLSVVLAVCMVGGLVACTVAEQKPDKGDNTGNNDYIAENMGYTLQLPEEYRDNATLRSADELDANTIIEVYQTATLETNSELGWGIGFLFRIVRHRPAEFEAYWPYRVTPTDHFAKDENYFYSIEWPSDVQSDSDVSIREEYGALVEQVSNIKSWFIINNGLTEYDNSAAETSEYTYPGVHAVFAVTLSNDAKFEVILSKPIRQSDDGIWCVERMYQENGAIHIAMPETDLTAMEYYTQLQTETDAGQHPELLNAETVARAYLDSVWDYARHIKDSSIEYTS